MKRKIHSLSDYKENIGEVHSKMTSIINLSFEDWNRIQEFSNTLNIGSVLYKPRTKAGIVHDHICHRVLREFYSDTDINVGEFNGVFGFLYKEMFFIRFKKMNSKTLNLSSINTNQNLKYLYQDSSIPGLPEKPTILYIGYTLDKTSSGIQGIYTACWNGNQLAWLDEHGIESIEQVSFDFGNDEDRNQVEVERVIKRVKVKTAYKKVSKSTGTH